MLDLETQIDIPQREWYAVYNIVRHEKTACMRVADKRIETFLPLRKVLSRWKDRNKIVHIPLFPGYFFIYICPSSQDQLAVLTTPGVVKILGNGGNLFPIPSNQITAIQTLLTTNLEFQPDEYDLTGREAIVIRGPLNGILGKVIERRGKHRLIISIDLIQRSVAAEVDIRDIELI